MVDHARTTTALATRSSHRKSLAEGSGPVNDVCYSL